MSSIDLDVGTKSYLDDVLLIKITLSHMESLLGRYNGYRIGEEASSKFGWTFFKLTFKPDLFEGIKERFSGMISKYPSNDQSQKFAKFMEDYFTSKGCNVKIKISNS